MLSEHLPPPPLFFLLPYDLNSTLVEVDELFCEKSINLNLNWKFLNKLNGKAKKRGREEEIITGKFQKIENI